MTQLHSYDKLLPRTVLLCAERNDFVEIKTEQTLCVLMSLLMLLPFAWQLSVGAQAPFEVFVATDTHYRPLSMMGPIGDENGLPGDPLYWYTNIQGELEYEAPRIGGRFYDYLPRSRHARPTRNAVNHFADIRKMVDIGSGAGRKIEEIHLSRYACYLTAQNGEPEIDPLPRTDDYDFAEVSKIAAIIK